MVSFCKSLFTFLPDDGCNFAAGNWCWVLVIEFVESFQSFAYAFFEILEVIATQMGRIKPLITDSFVARGQRGFGR
jgi:hypothetical protein